ncbi:MAG: hypothetical protein CL916_12670 [Deltaproteobacteria bacterium]|nr:hypothetical protein [Deltaproteobacteria bacterium]
MQEVGGGYGHYGAQNDLVLHFGVDASCELDVKVTWPNAARTEQTFTVEAGARYTIHQDEGLQE